MHAGTKLVFINVIIFNEEAKKQVEQAEVSGTLVKALGDCKKNNLDCLIS